jgi:type II secretory pathway pseudopilin PulG
MPATARQPARPALTLLEVVLAVTLLALIAGTAGTALSYVVAGQERQSRRMASAELANRLILQYLDDENSMPRPGTIIRYAADYYRWELTQEPLRMRAARQTPLPAGGTLRATHLERLKRVTVRVWLSEESGGAREWGPGVPGISITRLVDPLAFRNPDSFGNMLNTDEGMRRLLEQMMGVAPPIPPRSPTGSRK